MTPYDEEMLQQWTEREVRAAIGADPCGTVRADEMPEPWGRHRWFAEVVAEIAGVLALRRISETWKLAPPYPAWRDYAPAIRQRADAIILAAKLPPRTTFAEWFLRNEPLLQREPEKPERIAVVAAGLLPLFEDRAESWEATAQLDFDMSCGSFTEFLADWHSRVPKRCRSFVRGVAQEFGLEMTNSSSTKKPRA